MKDRLKKVIDTLSKKDISRFRVFIQKEKNLKNRKDLSLFEQILAGDKIPDSTAGTSPYHASRKRLMRKLTKFIMDKQQEEDETGITSISAKMAFARYLFDHHADEMAWIFLQKAERQAEKNEQYNLLHALYTMMVDYSHKAQAPDLHGIIQKRAHNKKRMDEDERAAIASGLIRQTLREKRQSGDTTSLEKVIDNTLAGYQLENIALKRPKLIYNILTITRHHILAKKEFHSFAPYVIKHYQRINKQGSFSGHNHFYKLGFLYMISHILYRSRKFKKASLYLDQMSEALEAYNRSQARQYFHRYLLLKAALNCYTGQLDTSIALLEEGLVNKEVYFPPLERLNSLINLAIYYFLKGKGREAIRTAMRIGHSDHWLEKHMGKEWVFKKNLMEAIALFETGEVKTAASRIRSVERNYSFLLDQSLYSRARPYIDFLKKLMLFPTSINPEEFSEEARKSLVTIPEEQEDLQAITFYSWLKSKIQQKNYYETLLETVKH